MRPSSRATTGSLRGTLRRETGFTLLEILISMLIIAVGVLGTAGLQAFALKVNQGGQLRSQAVILGIDFIERVEANNGATITGGYAPASYPTSYPVDCSTTYCQQSELATYDLVKFKARVLAQLPGASVTVSMTGAGPFTYSVSINWEERITSSKGAAAGAQSETFSYSISRMFQNRSLIV